MSTPSAPPIAVVPVSCPRCRQVVLDVTDGPALEIRQPLSREDAVRAGDVCGWCPGCGALVCVRILRSAA